MQLIRFWNRIWFPRSPAINLSVCRVFVVGAQLIVLLNGYDWYMEAHRFPQATYDPLAVLDLILLPFPEGFRVSREVLAATYWMTVAGGVLGVLGVLAYVSLPIVALGSIFLTAHRYSFGEIHHPGALLMVALVLLALSPSARVLTVSDFIDLARRRGTEAMNWDRMVDRWTAVESRFAHWPLLTIQTLLGIVYLDAGLSKVEEAGLDWVNGYTLQYYLAQDGMRWGGELAIWLSQHHLLVEPLSWTVLLFELTFITTVVFAPSRLVYIPLGIAFHVGIYVLMAATFFQFIALYAAFLPWANMFEHPTDVRRWFPRSAG